MALDTLPDDFTTLEEFREFWDTRSSANYEDVMTECSGGVDMEQIQLSQFQENVRASIAAAKRSDKSVLISDKGKLLVKIVPVSSSGQSWLGCMKDTAKIIPTQSAVCHRFFSAYNPAEEEYAAKFPYILPN